MPPRKIIPDLTGLINFISMHSLPQKGLAPHTQACPVLLTLTQMQPSPVASAVGQLADLHHQHLCFGDVDFP